MHFYEEHLEKVKTIASVQDQQDFGKPYGKTFKSLSEFDNLLGLLAKEEKRMRQEKEKYSEITFEDEFFSNWYNQFLMFHKKKYSGIQKGQC